MSAEKDPRGLKRVCVECKSRFYDLNKRPIICPNCGAEFNLDAKGKASRTVEKPVKVAEKKVAVANDDADEEALVDEANLDELDDEDLDNLDAIEDDDE